MRARIRFDMWEEIDVEERPAVVVEEGLVALDLVLVLFFLGRFDGQRAEGTRVIALHRTLADLDGIRFGTAVRAVASIDGAWLGSRFQLLDYFVAWSIRRWAIQREPHSSFWARRPLLVSDMSSPPVRFWI